MDREVYRYRFEPDPPEHLRDPAIDLAEFLGDQRPTLRSICERLGTHSVSEVSRETGIPRATIYESLKKLRRSLGAGRFHDYF